MADSNMQLNWTEEQWNRVRQVVYEEARKTRVAGNVLPLFGPLSPNTTFVARETIDEEHLSTSSGVQGIAVDDSNTLKLTTLQQFVYLKSSQVSDPDLSSALLAFRRAANRVARLEDEIVFRGQEGENMGPPIDDVVKDEAAHGSRSSPPSSQEVSGGQRLKGLLRSLDSSRALSLTGSMLVSAVCTAVGDLEKDKFSGPYACVLDNKYFAIANTPNDDSLVLPQDRILPFLSGGALVRSSSLPENTGLVIALSGEPIDLVVASDISVKFLHTTIEPRFVFRVSEKIVLRVKQEKAIRTLKIDASTPASGRPTEMQSLIAAINGLEQSLEKLQGRAPGGISAKKATRRKRAK